MWLVRRCETLAANAAVLDNMWSKPVADHSEAEFLVTVSSRGEVKRAPRKKPVWMDTSLIDPFKRRGSLSDRYILRNRLFSFFTHTKIVHHYFLFIHVFIAYLCFRIDLVKHISIHKSDTLAYSGLTSRWINQYLAFSFSLSYAADTCICFKQTSLLDTLWHHKGISSPSLLTAHATIDI